MWKAAAVGMSALAVALMVGCKPEEKSTAAYLGIDSSYLKTIAMSEDGKPVAYSIESVRNTNGRVNVGIVAVSDKIYPPTKIEYQITDSNIIEQKMVARHEYPLTFSESFPPSPGEKIQDGVTYKGPNGILEDCVSVTNGQMTDVFCNGYGKVETISKWVKNGVAKTGKSELIYFEKMDGKTADEYVPKIAAQVNAANAMLVPPADADAFKSWVKVCPDHVQTKDFEPLDPLGYAIACRCVFTVERENVATILEFSDSPNPLGNGEDAEKFFTSARRCVGD